MPNRLAQATSPYLLQHRDNPVDWWEWGDEAFAEATRRDVPVLVSIGYAACHWCHVMAHESFEDQATAAQMNDAFVCVKVDREERPDVDAVYMEATQALTGHGGWPMTVFLTPQGRPVFAGTYFPPTARQGVPAFRQVLAAIAEAWTERRADVDDAGERITAALAAQPSPAGLAPLGVDELAEAVTTLHRGFDSARGGFGGAPKFPPSMVLEWLIRHVARDANAPTAGPATDMAAATITAMARSGMYDQLAGGFARYSVDAGWVVPHFEKMLYDNALLARVYLHWWRLTQADVGRRVAVETCDFMVRELGTPQGGLAASLDADTPTGDGHGVEGLTYVWTPAQLVDALGPDDGAWVADLCGVTEIGTFEHGSSTLQLTRELSPSDEERWAAARAQLLAARTGRSQPARDVKVVAAWNGLAVAALGETGALADRWDLVGAARGVATLLLDSHLQSDGALRRVSRDGVVGQPAGVLEDYADLAEGLLALYAVTGEIRWYEAVSGLVEAMAERFWDEAADGFKDTAADAVDVPLVAALGGRGRALDATDGATPSGTSAAAGVLLIWSALTGSSRHRELAERALAQSARIAIQAPRAAGWALAVTEALADGPREVAVMGAVGDGLRSELLRVALAGTAPGLVVAAGAPGDRQDVGPALLADRPLVGGAPAAYPCRGMVCDLPLTDPQALATWVQAGWSQAGLPSVNSLDATE
jgi:uncharacterized protein YyaL (SSP411 family)